MTTKERPILFSGAMVKAILEGRKSQTRRVVKPQPTAWTINAMNRQWPARESKWGTVECCPCPYGSKGDRLWVRETFCEGYPEMGEDYLYRESYLGGADHKWKPSIFMPRCASRITLEIVNVRIDRLQDISEQDAEAEGIDPIIPTEADWWMPDRPNASMYRQLWDSINAKKYPWASNPWVWIVEFRKEKP